VTGIVIASLRSNPDAHQGAGLLRKLAMTGKLRVAMTGDIYLLKRKKIIKLREK